LLQPQTLPTPNSGSKPEPTRCVQTQVKSKEITQKPRPRRRSRQSAALSGLAGTNFHPLNAQLERIPLQSVFWELATAFGAARLISPDGARWVEIAAIGEELTWSPIHSRGDLLWMRSAGQPEPRATVGVAPAPPVLPSQAKQPGAARTEESKVPARRTRGEGRAEGAPA